MAPDIVIVGAGIIGCSVAYALARAGAGRIMVIDRGQPGAAASNAAAGMLVVASSRAPRGVLFELRRASAALFPDWIAALAHETDIDVGYQTQGLLELAFTDAEANALKNLVRRRQAQGFAAQDVDPATARAMEPSISAEAVHAALFPTDCSVNNGRLVQALHRAASARGVVFRLGAPVTAIETAGTRATAVVAGERFTPGRLVIAAGLGSRAIGTLLRVRIPVRPDKGEMVALCPAVPIGRMLVWNDGYLVPRKDGEVIVGGTSLRGAADTTVTPSTLAFLLRRATRMVPSLAGATSLRSWAGVRPLSELRRPIIGPARGYENVVVATGHHRNGILLAPITAQLVTELITRDATSIPIHPFCHKSR
jgi:glycine oxidase